MRILGIVPLVLMAAAGVVAGFRLLALGRRTRQLPELLIGSGLVLATVVGGPLTGVGRAPALALTPIGDALFAAGLVATQLGIALLAAFTWVVFRRDSLWATALFALIAGALGAEWLGLVTASASGATLEEVLPRTRPWGVSIVATLGIVFAWSGAESFARYLRLRRQLALGLADPVAADRILLWAIAGLATVVLCAAIAACMLAGMAPLAHPLPLVAIAATSLCSSLCWTLAFVPPAAYLARVRARSTATR